MSSDQTIEIGCITITDAGREVLREREGARAEFKAPRCPPLRLGSPGAAAIHPATDSTHLSTGQLVAVVKGIEPRQHEHGGL
jgi:hypothetical protein